MESPGADGKIDPASPELVMTLEDGGSGVDGDHLQVEVDGQVLPAEFDPETGRARVDLSALTADREHRLEIRAQDHAGNIVRESRALTGGAEFAVTEFLAVPNPARITTVIRYRLHQTMDSVDMKIYDVSGRRVARLEAPVFAGLNQVDWTLTTDDGERVGAGVYFCRLTARLGDRKLKHIAKIAVMP